MSHCLGTFKLNLSFILCWPFWNSISEHKWLHLQKLKAEQKLWIFYNTKSLFTSTVRNPCSVVGWSNRPYTHDAISVGSPHRVVKNPAVQWPNLCAARTNLCILIVSPSFYLLDGGWMTSLHMVRSIGPICGPYICRALCGFNSKPKLSLNLFAPVVKQVATTFYQIRPITKHYYL